MKRLILTATAVLFSALTLFAQPATSAPRTGTPSLVLTAAHSQHPRNRQRNRRHQPRHHTGINARR